MKHIDHHHQPPIHETRTKIMAFFCRFISANGIPPTLREITDACDIKSTAITSYHVAQLIAAGELVDVLGRNKSRGVTLPRAAAAAQAAASAQLHLS